MKTKSLVIALVALASLLVAAPARGSFGVDEFKVTARNADGTIDELAARHPFALEVHLAMNTDQDGQPEGALRSIQIDLPAGLIGNARNSSRCPRSEFAKEFPGCPGSTQVGVVRIILSGLGLVTAPVYNVVASQGSAAMFGVSVDGSHMVQQLRLVGIGEAAAVRLGGSLPLGLSIIAVDEEIWGVPAAPAHDQERICQSTDGGVIEGCASDDEERPLLTLPASCDEPMRTRVTATAADPPVAAVANALSRDAGGNPSSLAGCAAVPFDPRLTVQSEAAALAPTGLSVRLEVPQYDAARLPAPATVAGVRAVLPEGVVLNPSAGSWLASCAVPMDEQPVRCPAGSRIGSMRVRTPLIDHELEGAVYVAQPDSSPIDSGLRITLVIEDDETGTLLKIPGRLEADPGDGRLVVTVWDLPRFPFDEMEIELVGGPRAPLTSPPMCGRYTYWATFTPSTSPFSPPVGRSARTTLSSGPEGSACPLPEAVRHVAATFLAGVTSPAAGLGSPLVFTLSREDIDQHFRSYDLHFPPGLIADLGSTPVGTAVGSVEVKAGLGPQPLALEGTVYFKGPYRGAPYSLRVVVPARAGPLDLGTIVQRAALFVDPATAQVRVVSDPLPRILAGVPLEIRSLKVDVDRPGFVRNPTSCEPMAITGTATTSLGQTAPLSDRFQVGGCAALPFKPKATLRFAGSLRRNGHPALRAVLRGSSDEASIARAGFSLPRGELLDLRHLRGLCAQGTAPERCPGSSRLGQLRLISPLFDQPAEGSLYLVAPSRRLPELLAEVQSGDLRFVLLGRTVIRNGRFGISFPAIPDIPLSRAEFSLAGGLRGLFVNSRSLCRGVGEAEVSLGAHSGKRRQLRLRPRVVGC